jgi:hypothetical protein
MGRLISTWVLGMLLSLLMICPPVLAGPTGNGHGQGAGSQGQGNSGRPAGFSQGNKQGWQGNPQPRGWSNAKGQKKGWGGNTVPKGVGKKQLPTTPQ